MSGSPMRLRNPFLSQGEVEEDEGCLRHLSEGDRRDRGVSMAPWEEGLQNECVGEADDDDCPTPPYVPCRYRVGLSASAFVFKLD